MIPIGVAESSLAGLRHGNEDSVAGGSLGRNAQIIRAFLAVADGMGGMAAGDVASSLAIREVQRLLEDEVHRATGPDRMPWAGILRDIVRAVNARVYAETEENPVLNGMGTTLTVGVVFDDGDYIIAHVGDSRAYHLSPFCDPEQLTVDHNAAAEAVASGMLSPEAARTHPFANALTRSIGEATVPAVDIVEGHLHDGDILLLCTDGVHKAVEPADLQSLMYDAHSLKQATHEATERALANGSDDNVTVIALQYGDVDRPSHSGKRSGLVYELERRWYHFGVLEWTALGLFVAFVIALAGLSWLINRDEVSASDEGTGPGGGIHAEDSADATRAPEHSVLYLEPIDTLLEKSIDADSSARRRTDGAADVKGTPDVRPPNANPRGVQSGSTPDAHIHGSRDAAVVKPASSHAQTSASDQDQSRMAPPRTEAPMGSGFAPADLIQPDSTPGRPNTDSTAKPTVSTASGVDASESIREHCRLGDGYLKDGKIALAIDEFKRAVRSGKKPLPESRESQQVLLEAMYRLWCAGAKALEAESDAPPVNQSEVDNYWEDYEKQAKQFGHAVKTKTSC
ncbi:MAG: protein phosphatase 2C domain-containing protein [Ignavibacteriae bacterium]|nr:protein phosphatase 2C domain-containing protein [Ignavibacteriota bacterium]